MRHVNAALDINRGSRTDQERERLLLFSRRQDSTNKIETFVLDSK